ncbi:bifunctional diguanylate cyclase/phosphohydrolase [Candidatus Darwinibacter acetoxidans]
MTWGFGVRTFLLLPTVGVLAAALVLNIGQKHGFRGRFSHQLRGLKRHLRARRYVHAVERLKSTLSSLSEGVIATDLGGRIEVVNTAAQEMIGWSRTEALGKNAARLLDFIPGENRESFADCLEGAISSGRTIELPACTLVTRHGNQITVLGRVAPLKDRAGKITGAVFMFRDNSHQNKQLPETKQSAYCDEMTNLPNRLYWERRQGEFEAYRLLSIVRIDVCGIELTRDVFGSVVSDQAFQEVVLMLKGLFPDDALLLRWGERGFLGVFPNSDERGAEEWSWQLKRTVQVNYIGCLPIVVTIGWAAKRRPDEKTEEVLQRAEDHLSRQKLFQGLRISQNTIQDLMSALWRVIPWEEAHAKRTSLLCQQIGRELGFPKCELDRLGQAGLFHDIGKIAICKQVLNKAGPLTDIEWQEIMRHPVVGFRLLSAVPGLADIAAYILGHHERWDGFGYPHGLRGDEIPIQSRIAALADAYDAMVSKRPYKNALSERQALEELQKGAGTQFDPEIVKVFVDALSRGKISLQG